MRIGDVRQSRENRTDRLSFAGGTDQAGRCTRQISSFDHRLSGYTHGRAPHLATRGSRRAEKEEMIQALPATFSGVRFRSRTEARWAVFMTELGVEWSYEHEAFALPSGNYLPDFWLPTISTGSALKSKTEGLFVEIRGTDSDDSRLPDLAQVTQRRVILLVGTPAEYLRSVRWVYGDGRDGLRTSKTRSFMICGPGCGDQPYFWTICPHCSVIGIEFDGRSARLKHTGQCSVIGSYEDKNYNALDKRILKAVETSQSWKSPEGG